MDRGIDVSLAAKESLQGKKATSERPMPRVLDGRLMPSSTSVCFALHPTSRPS